MSEYMSKRSKKNRPRTVTKKMPDNTVLPDEKEVKDMRTMQFMERKKHSPAVADQLAGSEFHQRNWYYKGGVEAFPLDQHCRYVNKMYPYAEGGPLLVDEPRFPYEVERCEKKKAVMSGLGYRYVIIHPEMSMLEAQEELDGGGLVRSEQGNTGTY